MHFPIPSNFCLLVFCRLGILSALCGCKRSVFFLVRWYPFFGTLAKFKRKIIFWSSGRTRWYEEHFSSGMLQFHPHMKRASVDPCCSPFGIFITTKWKILKRDLLAIFTYTHTHTLRVVHVCLIHRKIVHFPIHVSHRVVLIIVQLLFEGSMDFSSEMILHDDTGMRTTLLPRAVDCYGNMATEDCCCLWWKFGQL